jgi:hypothetical protein
MPLLDARYVVIADRRENSPVMLASWMTQAAEMPVSAERNGEPLVAVRPNARL